MGSSHQTEFISKCAKTCPIGHRKVLNYYSTEWLLNADTAIYFSAYFYTYFAGIHELPWNLRFMFYVDSFVKKKPSYFRQVRGKI